jgi:hypothetical protein
VESRPDWGAVSGLVFVFGAHAGTSLVPPVIGRTKGEPDIGCRGHRPLRRLSATYRRERGGAKPRPPRDWLRRVKLRPPPRPSKTAPALGSNGAVASVPRRGMDTSGKPYVGRSVDLARRLLEHLATDPIRIDSTKGINVKVIRGLGDAVDDALSIAEQLAMNACNGETGVNNLANQINAINRKRRQALDELKPDVDRWIDLIGTW